MKHELGLEIELTRVLQGRLTRIAENSGPDYFGVANKTSCRSYVFPLWLELKEGPNEAQPWPVSDTQFL